MKEKQNGKIGFRLPTDMTLKQIYKKYGIIIVMIVLIAVAGIIEPIFLTSKNIVNVLRQVSINGILAVGMTFVIISGGIDLSLGSIVGFSGMVSVMIMPEIGILPAILVALACGIVIGFINGLCIYNGVPEFIMTLATLTSIRGLAYYISNGQPFPGTDEAYKFIGQSSIGPVPMPVIVFIVVVALAFFVLRKTTFGRSVYAIGGSSEASRLSGINIFKTKVAIYMLSGFLASVAAIVLTSRLYSCDPTIGEGYELDAITATVIGGTSMSGGEGSVLRTVIGVLIIGILSNILNLLSVSPYIQEIVKGLIIFGAVAADTWKKSK